MKKVIINNFKGIKELTVELDKVTNLHASNGGFKSTFKDAISWCLTGRDGEGRSDYEIKTREGDEVKTHLDHSVKLEFEDFTVERVYAEKWQHKRGEATKSFTGHTTTFMVDNEPVSKGKYEKFLEEKIHLSKILMMVHPGEFAEMPWKNRRKIVFEIAGEVGNDYIIDNMPGYYELKAILGDDTPDDIIDKMKKQQGTVNKKIREYTTRIDEAEKKMPEKVDIATASNQIVTLESEISTIQKEIDAIAVDADLWDKLQKIKADKIQAQAEHNEAENAKQDAYRDQHAKEHKAWTAVNNEARTDLYTWKDRNDIKARTLSKLARDEKGFKDSFDSKKNSVWEGETTCYACKQDLPASEVEEAEKRFNLEKSEALLRINNQLKEVRSGIEAAQLLPEKALDDLEAIVDALKLTEPKMFQYIKVPFDDSEYQKKAEEVLEAIKTAESTRDERRAPLKQQQTEKREKILELKIILSKHSDREKAETYIDNLKSEQSEFVKQYQEKMKIISMCEAFIKKKSEIMSEPIYRNFGVNFRMYQDNINGGVSSDCEVMVKCNGNHIPFAAANNASRINTGMQLCEVLQKYYEVDLPVIVDNAESVVELAGIDRQVIRLVVDKDYETLTKVEEIND